jgi:hypothetical protein
MKRYFFAIFIGLVGINAAGASDLSGRVVDFQNRPLAEATVLVNTAAPRQGVAVFCPSCYVDCGKRTTTDDEGRFMFNDLDPSLVFYLVATAEGHRARVSERIDPASDAAQIALEALPTDLSPERVVRGRVIDERGKQVVGAQVNPYGCQTADRRWWGSLPGVDSVSITNANGEFIITSREPAEAFDLEVRSPRHAAKRFGLLATGESHELAVEAGVLVRGRLLKDGQPVAGVSVGLVQCDRGSENFLGNYAIGTNAKGEFEFTYVPPNDDFYIYTTMESIGQPASLPLRRLRIGKSGSLADVGDLELAAAHSIFGRIVLTDGAPVPGPIQLLLTREGAWDSQRFMVDSDGAFRFENVPDQEPITLVARIPGYHLDQNRTRFQQVREWSIAFFVEGPRDDVEIFYAPDVVRK